MSCDMWFGTQEYSRFVPTPLSGADVSAGAWSDSGGLLDGQGYGINSFNSHKEYVFSWSESETRETAQTMMSFYSGSFGRGKLYFQDPLTYDTNVLPARWADPSITCNYEGPSLIPGVNPIRIAASGATAQQRPVYSAQYNLNGATPVVQADFVEVAKNLFTNPKLTPQATPSGALRINYCANPRFAGGSTTLWADLGTNSTPITADTADSPPQGDYSLYCVTSGTAAGEGVTMPANTIAYFINQAGSYTVASAWVLVPEGVTAEFALRLFTTPTEFDQEFVTDVVGTGEWERVSVAYSVTPGNRRHAVALRTKTAESVKLRINGVLLEGPVSTATPGEYFDANTGLGDYSDPDLVGYHSGAELASSIQLGAYPPEGAGAAFGLFVATARNGKPALRTIAPVPIATFPNYGVLVQSGAPVDGTALATFEVMGSAAPGLVAPPNQLAVAGGGPDGHESPGTYQDRLNFTGNTGGQIAVFGAGTNDGDTYITDIFVTDDPDYTGPYFDGDTGTVVIDGRVCTTRWNEDGTSSAGYYTAASNPTLNDDNSVYITIPDGYELHVGAWYSATGSAGIFVTPMTATGPTFDVIPVSPNSGSDLFSVTISKAPSTTGVRLYLGKLDYEPASLTVNAIHARLVPTGRTPKNDNHWYGGQGNAGVRFMGPPTYINHTGVNGGQVEFAASFIESVV